MQQLLLNKSLPRCGQPSSPTAGFVTLYSPSLRDPVKKDYKSESHVKYFVAQLQADLEQFYEHQKIHSNNIKEQLKTIGDTLDDIARRDPQHLTCSYGEPKLRWKSFKRLQYDFHFCTVVMSWGRLRRKRPNSDLDLELSDHEAGKEQRQPPGFAACIEVLPALWLSRRAIIGNWKLLRDQRASPMFYPHLSFPVLVPDDSLVMRYASSNNTQGLRDLFTSSLASVNDRTCGGWTPLHIAAAAGHMATCRYLLRHNAEVTSTGHIGLTPLHLAAAYGHLDVVKILVENNSDPEVYNQHGFNTIFEVLHSPFIADHAIKATIIIWILQQEYFDINVNSQDYRGNSVLGWFAQHYPGGVELLIGHNADVNTRANDGANPLHKAAASGSFESVKLLIENGADMNAIENDGSTALVRAAERGFTNIVQHLTRQSNGLPLQRDIKQLARTTYEPVLLQCQQGMPGPSDLVNKIIKICSQLKATDQLKVNEIWHASRQGYWYVVSKLQEAGVDPYQPSEYGYRALVRLVYKEDIQGVNQLIESGSHFSLPDNDLVLSLTRAAAAGHRQIVSHLLSLTTVDFFDNALASKALVAAARYGHFDIVEILLRSVPEHCWYKALVRAAENGHLNVVILLLERHVHPTRRSIGGDTAIVRAARYGHLDVVRSLLDSGADPNQHGWFGYSALVRAAYNNHIDVVDCLLNAGADPDLPEIEGDCAMVRAVRQGYIRIVARLEQAGARPIDDNAQEKKDGPSKALMKAAIYNDEKNLIRLLNEGANPNTVEADGNTPLSRACEKGHANVVDILISKGAQPGMISQKVASPLERAAEGGHLAIVKALTKAHHKVTPDEKCKAMVKAAERGYAEVAAFLIEDGVKLQDLQAQAYSASATHFNILDFWMKSVVGDEQKLNPGMLPRSQPPCVQGADAFLPGSQKWGDDGSKVVKFRWPFHISFSSDLTSSAALRFLSSLLLSLVTVFEQARNLALFLCTFIIVFLGLITIGIKSLV